MTLKRLSLALTVCKISTTMALDLRKDFYFIAKTEDELSLVCKTEDVPIDTVAREDGWRGFAIQGVLDFSLIGILAELSGILAQNEIGLFAVSTYNTDYLLVKEADFDKAAAAFTAAGHDVI
ncbi:MAG: ACT domain-containing protein [Clostridiales bacterium]|nr:ACT domain-containing protein [Clostridiales bacterium]